MLRTENSANENVQVSSDKLKTDTDKVFNFFGFQDFSKNSHYVRKITDKCFLRLVILTSPGKLLKLTVKLLFRIKMAEHNKFVSYIGDAVVKVRLVNNMNNVFVHQKRLFSWNIRKRTNTIKLLSCETKSITEKFSKTVTKSYWVSDKDCIYYISLCQEMTIFWKKRGSSARATIFSSITKL